MQGMRSDDYHQDLHHHHHHHHHPTENSGVTQSPRFASTAIQRSQTNKKKVPPTWFSCPSFHTPGALLVNSNKVLSTMRIKSCSSLFEMQGNSQSNKYQHPYCCEITCIIKSLILIVVLFFVIYALSAPLNPTKKRVVIIAGSKPGAAAQGGSP